MIRNTLWLLLALAATAQGATPPALLQPLPAQAEAAAASARIFSHYHYQALPLDDALSGRILDRYLKSLDPERVFFLQSDIDQFARARTVLDDAILERDLAIPFAIFNRYQARVWERLNSARSQLAGQFDFKVNEGYPIKRAEAPWAASEEELAELWRKRVKSDWLSLKLAGKDDAAIRTVLDKRYDTALTRGARYKSEDVFQIFMNAYAESIEPHTNYLSPRASEDFAISMRLSLVGIGAVLQERDDYVTIRELVPGGPAARSGQMAVGDRIVGVAQGPQEPVTDLLGWRVDEAVSLIRGTKDTPVVLDILPAGVSPDTPVRKVSLVRETITLDKQAAHKAILPVGSPEAPRKVGVITLPAFYQDFDARRKGDEGFRSASRDVARLLAELKAEKVDAVLMDLRNNGGGALDEAVKLTGLFIDQGPVVQQRDAKGRIKVEYDPEAGLAWDGPLGVLINRGSASASEIFAAAVQDYGRGLILGEKSFGKGTVQTIIDLDELARSETPRYGELKMTVAQFFRIDGGTTQLRGVAPDLPLVAINDGEPFGEASFGNALPWTRIQSVEFSPAGQSVTLLPQLASSHAARVARDRDYRNLEEDAAELAALRNRASISLNEAERRQEKAQREARLKARAAAAGKNPAEAPLDDGLEAGERGLAEELAAEKARKAERDVLLDEAAQVLGDTVGLLRADTTLAARVLPGKAVATH